MLSADEGVRASDDEGGGEKEPCLALAAREQEDRASMTARLLRVAASGQLLMAMLLVHMHECGIATVSLDAAELVVSMLRLFAGLVGSKTNCVSLMKSKPKELIG